MTAEPWFAALLGRPLVSVEFILDHVRLGWDEGPLDVFASLSVVDGHTTLHASVPGWRDALCSCIEVALVGVEDNDQRTTLIMANGKRLVFSYDDRSGPEAAVYYDRGREVFVVFA